MGHAILSPSASGRYRGGQAVHNRLYRKYGYAKEHPCVLCGGQAKHWAYLYTGGEHEVRVGDSGPWSPRLEDYAPMCPSCHSRFDRENDPRMAERVKDASRAVPRSLRKKAGDAFALKRETDQEFRGRCEEQQREAAVLGGKAVWSDPEFAERHKKVLKKAALQRWECEECGYVSNAGTVQRHLNRTGHLGRRETNA